MVKSQVSWIPLRFIQATAFYKTVSELLGSGSRDAINMAAFAAENDVERRKNELFASPSAGSALF